LLPPYDIKILGVPFGHASFTFFFGKGFKQGFSTCKHVFEIRRHLCGFWYPLLMFCLNAFFFVLLLPPLPTFQKQLIVFYSTLVGMF
jgi:hypothetical protein